MRAHRLLWSAVILTFATLAAPAGGQALEGDLFALLGAIDNAAAQQAWPGFRCTSA